MELTLTEAIQKGVEAHKAGELQEADRYYTAILKANPKHPDANHNMGVLAVGVGKVEAALPFFKTALEVKPSMAQFWLSYIDALIKLDQIEDAKAVLEQAKSKGAKGDGFDQIEKQLGIVDTVSTTNQISEENQIQALMTMYSQRRLDLVFEETQKLTKKYPKNLNLWNLMGASAAQIGEIGKAIFAFQKVISIKPDSAEAYNNMGIALKEKGKLEDAIEAYTKALSFKPNFAEAYNNMGIALQEQGKLEDAIEACTKALSLNPNYAEAYYNMGITLKDQGNLEDAIEAYTKAITIKPDYAEAHNNMGTALKDQGKLEGAIEAYNKALSLKPSNAEACYNMGIALKDQGKLEDAIEAYTKALSFKPNFAEAYNNMGVALKDQGKLEDAIEAYTKALSLKPNYADVYNNATGILKTHPGNSKKAHILFKIDSKIKKLSLKMLYSTSNSEITNNLLEGLDYIKEDNFKFKTPLSQVYMHAGVDLNCKRHLKIFDTKDVIPEFCFGCFKVQVEVSTLIDLIKITSLFYKFDFEKDLTKKTMIELRSNISGYYKGFIYCEGLAQAKAVKNVLDISLKELFGEKIISTIKRGCSEYSLRFPEYGKIAKKSKNMMSFPREWKLFEEQFDQNELIEPTEQVSSLSLFCLSDFYIFQKWIDYAKGIGDKSIESFNDRPILFTDVYEAAIERKNW